MHQKNVKRGCWRRRTRDAKVARRVGAFAAICFIVVASPDTGWPQEDGPTVQSGESGTIDIRARETRLVDILQQLADTSDRNIVIGPAVNDRRVTVSLKGMTLTEVLNAILPSAGCDYRDRGKFLIVDTTESFLEPEAAEETPAIKVVKLKYTRAVDMVEMITPFLGPSGRVVASPETETGIDGDETGGNSMAGGEILVIEETPARLKDILQVINDIDVQPAQVLVEATIVRAALDDDSQLGIDFNFLAGVDFEGVGSTSLGGVDLVTGAVPPRQFEDGVLALNTGFTTAIGGEGFNFGFIKNNLAVFIRALEELTDTTVLANPKVLALNKQRGSVIIGRRDGYITTTVTETAAVQSVEFLETGTQLTFRPFVVDNKRVRMEIHVEDSAGGLTPSDLPFESTTESTSNILVEDGHTVVIGGLFRESNDVSRSQVPALGEVPGFGALFRRSQDKSRREEVIVLLTVHIITDEQSHHEAGRQMLERVDQIRLGIRERIQWFGRRRLAEAHIASAIDHLNGGRLDRALFHTRLARAADPVAPAGRRIYGQLVEGRDTIGPDNDMRMWVARQLIEKPTVDAVIGQRIEYRRKAPEVQCPP